MKRIAAMTVVLVLAGCGGDEPDEPVGPSSPPVSPESAEVDVELEGCDPATGTVTNGTDVPANVYVTVAFLDADGVRIDDEWATVQALAAGQTARWDVEVDLDYATCEVASVELFPAD